MKKTIILIAAFMVSSVVFADQAVKILMPDVLLLSTEKVKSLEGATGCSLHCSHLIWMMDASSAKKGHEARNADDWSFKSSWISEKNGKGEYLLFKFPRVAFFNRDLEPAKWTGFMIVNGAAKNAGTFKEYSRAKKVKLYLNDAELGEIDLEDSISLQSFAFETPVVLNADDVIKAEVTEVYPGSSSSVAITQFMLNGAHDIAKHKSDIK